MSALPEGYRLEADPARFDRDAIHAFLSTSYWSPGIPRERMELAIDHSLGIGAFHGDAQIGFARAVTDYAHFAYLADVYVLEGHRGQGIARAMVQWLHDHPRLQGLRRWLLVTRDAQALYAALGYGEPEDLGQFMQRRPERAW